MGYTYGKTFKKNGKLVRYRYWNGKQSTKKLVAAPSKKKKYPFRGRKSSTTKKSYRRY